MPLKLVYLTSIEGDIYTLIKAANKISEEHGPVIRICARTQSDLSHENNITQIIDEARGADLVIFHLMGGKDSLPGFDRVLQAAREHGAALYVQPASAETTPELRELSTVTVEEYTLIQKYICYGGTENITNMLLWIINSFGDHNLAVREPEMLPWEGIYHPRLPAEIELRSYIKKHCQPGRLTVGIIFYRNHWITENIVFVDALIESLEKQDVNVIPVFLHATRDVELGTKGIQWVVENYFMQDGRPIIDVLISTLSFSHFTTSNEGNGSDDRDNCLLRLGVPVIKAITSVNNYEKWSNTVQGLNPLDVCMSVAMPEFDGALITVPIATREYGKKDPLTGSSVVYYRPISERMDKAVRLAINWGKLRRKPNS